MSSNRVAPSFDGLHEVEDHVEGNDTGAGAINVLITKQNTGSTASEKGSDSENDGARNDAAAGKRRSSYQHTNVDRDMFRIESEEEEQDNDWGRPSCSQRVGGCCVTLNQRVTYGLAQSGRVCKICFSHHRRVAWLLGAIFNLCDRVFLLFITISVYMYLGQMLKGKELWFAIGFLFSWMPWVLSAIFNWRLVRWILQQFYGDDRRQKAKLVRWYIACGWMAFWVLDWLFCVRYIISRPKHKFALALFRVRLLSGMISSTVMMIIMAQSLTGPTTTESSINFPLLAGIVGVHFLFVCRILAEFYYESSKYGQPIYSFMRDILEAGVPSLPGFQEIAEGKLEEVVFDGNLSISRHIIAIYRAFLEAEESGAFHTGFSTKVLVARRCQVNNKGAGALGRILSFHHGLNLVELNLEFNNIGDRGAILLSQGLKNNFSLLRLLLKENVIGDRGGVRLGEALFIHPTLEVLDLRGNQLGDDDCVGRSTTLTALYLGGNLIEDDGATALAKAVTRSPTVLTFDLARNHITWRCGRFFGQCLQKNKVLQELLIEKNELEDDGVAYVAKGLALNTTLLHLNLQQTEIETRGVAAIGAALEQNQCLRRLNLSQNYIANDSVEPLAIGLSMNKTLEFLDVSDNKLSSSGAGRLASTLVRDNLTLVKLFLGGNNVKDKFKEGRVIRRLGKRVEFEEPSEVSHMTKKREVDLDVNGESKAGPN